MGNNIKKRKIIIDTDIGDDIDDILAVALALKSPEIDLVGITTVYENVTARAKIAARLLRIAGMQDIPIAVGLGSPLLNKADGNILPCQYSDKYESETGFYKGDAVDFLIEKISESDKDITIVAIGPLTNIACAIAKKPEIKEKIEKIVIMGGAYYQHMNEWNTTCDPEAARIVHESEIDIIAVGVDVTLKCKLNDSQIEKIQSADNPLTDFLSETIKMWECGQVLYLHDALAVAVVIDESLVETENGIVQVETRGECTRGMTFNSTDITKYWTLQNEDVFKLIRKWNESELNSNTKICFNVDNERFVDLFLKRILN